MTNDELVQAYQSAWDDLEGCGGQSSSSDSAYSQIEELEQELRRRGLQPATECSYAPYFCPYGCPGSREDYWES